MQHWATSLLLGLLPKPNPLPRVGGAGSRPGRGRDEFIKQTKGKKMSDPYREPRPLSPERLSLFSIDCVQHEDYMVKVSATFLFNPYTPDWEGELSRAVSTLTKVISDAAVNAERKRERKGAKQYEGLAIPGFENLVVPTILQGES